MKQKTHFSVRYSRYGKSIKIKSEWALRRDQLKLAYRFFHLLLGGRGSMKMKVKHKQVNLLSLTVFLSRYILYLLPAGRLRNLEKMCSRFLAAVFYLGKH